MGVNLAHFTLKGHEGHGLSCKGLNGMDATAFKVISECLPQLLQAFFKLLSCLSSSFCQSVYMEHAPAISGFHLHVRDLTCCFSNVLPNVGQCTDPCKCYQEENVEHRHDTHATKERVR